MDRPRSDSRQPANSFSGQLQRSASRMLIYLQSRPDLTFVFAMLVFCSVLSQIFILSLRRSPTGDDSTDHWYRFRHRGGMWRAPAVAFQHSNFRGWRLPIHENVSDLSELNFDDISSMRVSKGVTVVLYSNKSWTGREISIDNDIKYIGHKWNDRALSIALEFEDVTPHAVEFFRTGASMGLVARQCPRNLVCAPDATLDAVPRSVYMAISNMLREKLLPLVGCRISAFLRPDGRKIYGMLPQKVYYLCEGDNFILPAEPPGFHVNIDVPSLFRRVKVGRSARAHVGARGCMCVPTCSCACV